MHLTLPVSHYIFAVIFCTVLSLWILQQWIRREVQALAEIINPLQVLKVLISAKQNTASILLWARRGDQSEIHSLWNWFAKPASKPLHTLSRFLFFPTEVNNVVVSSLAWVPCSSQQVQGLLPNQACVMRWTGKLCWPGKGVTGQTESGWHAGNVGGAAKCVTRGLCWEPSASLERWSQGCLPAAESLGPLESLRHMSCDSNRKVGVVGHRWSNLTFEKIF